MSLDFATRTAWLTEFAITLNSNLAWEDGDTTGADSKFDARGVITHEAGHVVGLDDLRSLQTWRLTMFGSAFTDFPPNATTLGCGDLLGVRSIYGEATTNCATVTND